MDLSLAEFVRWPHRQVIGFLWRGHAAEAIASPGTSESSAPSLRGLTIPIDCLRGGSRANDCGRCAIPAPYIILTDVTPVSELISIRGADRICGANG